MSRPGCMRAIAATNGEAFELMSFVFISDYLAFAYHGRRAMTLDTNIGQVYYYYMIPKLRY